MIKDINQADRFKPYPWSFLRENPLDKTIEVEADEIIAPIMAAAQASTAPDLVLYEGEIDLFDDNVPTDAILKAIAVMICLPKTRFLVPTIKPGGAAGVLSYLRPHLSKIEAFVNEFGNVGGVKVPPCFSIRRDLEVVPNLALGVAIWDQATANERIPALLQVPADFHFAIYGPPLGPIDLRTLDPYSGLHKSLGYRLDALEGRIDFADGNKIMEGAGRLDWILATGSSRGFKSEVHPEWIVDLCAQADQAKVDVAFGNWGKLVPTGDRIGVDLETIGNSAGRLVEANFMREKVNLAVSSTKLEAWVMRRAAETGEAFPPLLEGTSRFAIPERLWL